MICVMMAAGERAKIAGLILTRRIPILYRPSAIGDRMRLEI